jgi:hypothetical protein
MADQAKNTLLSLMTNYQLTVNSHEYEVIIVENESPRLMDEGFIRTLPENFSYFLRKEEAPTPVHAINFGAAKATGENICIMIDGARMLTPGLIRNTILGHSISGNAVVTVPSYHLGHQIQQEAVKTGYGVNTERALLQSISWPEDGYRLFEIACFSRSSAPGFFLPNSESNSISMSRALWAELGGCETRFNMCGGGFVNLDLYKRVCEFPGIQHVILPGEGTFHQFHGGVTTGGKRGKDRDALMTAIVGQYRVIRGQEYYSPETTPIYLGEIPVQAQQFVQESSQRISELDISFEKRLSQHKKLILKNPASAITRFQYL